MGWDPDHVTTVAATVGPSCPIGVFSIVPLKGFPGQDGKGFKRLDSFMIVVDTE